MAKLASTAPSPRLTPNRRVGTPKIHPARRRRTTRLVVLSEHAIYRHGLRSLLETEPDFSVVGGAADCTEALRLVRERRPDILLVDLATSHGGGHFTGSILHARSAGDLRDVIVRRYTAAWGELRNHAMPVATAVAIGSAAFALTHRRRLLAPVDADPAWAAALAGGLTAGVVGALAEDSGPVLLVVATFTLGCVATYLWGRAPLAVTRRGSPGKSREARSHAQRPPAAPSR